MACMGRLPHVEDALAVGALGERGGLECSAADPFGDGDAAAGAGAALDAGDGVAATPATDVFVEAEGWCGDAGGLLLAAAEGVGEAGGEGFAAGLERGELGLALSTGGGEGLLGGGARGGRGFDLLHDEEEFVFEGGPLLLERFDFVLDGGELFRVADGAVVEAAFFGLDAGGEAGDACFEVALLAAELLVGGIGGGEGGFGSGEGLGVRESGIEVGDGGFEASDVVVDFLEGAEFGDKRHRRPGANPSAKG